MRPGPAACPAVRHRGSGTGSAGARRARCSGTHPQLGAAPSPGPCRRPRPSSRPRPGGGAERAGRPRALARAVRAAVPLRRHGGVLGRARGRGVPAPRLAHHTRGRRRRPAGLGLPHHPAAAQLRPGRLADGSGGHRHHGHTRSCVWRNYLPQCPNPRGTGGSLELFHRRLCNRSRLGCQSSQLLDWYHCVFGVWNYRRANEDRQQGGLAADGTSQAVNVAVPPCQLSLECCM